jgi:drug/metabolite transporter (DMT)-like permease
MNTGIHPVEAVFLRNLLAALMLLPLVFWRGPSLLRSKQLPLYGLRVLVSLLSMQAWFYAISQMPIGDVQAIGFMAPVFGTVGAILLLGERVRLRRWTAIIVGFLGAMVVLRPGSATFGTGQACAIFSALSAGLGAIMIKQLTTIDDADKIVLLTNLMLTPLSLIPALFVWTWPTLDAVIPILGTGLTAALAHITLVRGYAATDASLAMTFEFSRLPFAVAIAYFAFGETIDAWTWVGAAIIFSASLYIARREALLARQRREQAKSGGNAA